MDRMATEEIVEIVGRISAAVSTAELDRALVRLNMISVGLVEVPPEVKEAVGVAADFVWRVKDACERGPRSVLAEGGL
jgi:hypothetical protein